MTAKPNSVVTVGKARFGNSLPLALIAGPCALESRAHAFEMAAALKEITARLGVSFGYNTLVSDMRALPVLRATGYPVVFDATHSVQQPGGQGNKSGGERAHVPVLARAAVAVGVAALFMETHQDPDRAPSDGPNMVKLKDMPSLLAMLIEFDRIAKAHPLANGTDE